MTTAYLSLGSNVGNRLATLQSAVADLEDAGLHISAVSSVYETDPVGGPAQDKFFNIVAQAQTWMSATEVFELCHAVEDAHGRTRTEHWGPRTLDIDLLVFDDLELESDTLTIPHPRAHERGFVLVPWFDIDPECEIPGHGTVGRLAQQVGRQGVRKVADNLGAAVRA